MDNIAPFFELEIDAASPSQSFLADKAVANTTSHMTLSVLGEDVMRAVFAFRDGRYQECVRLIMKRRFPERFFSQFPSLRQSPSLSLFSLLSSLPNPLSLYFLFLVFSTPTLPSA
jgi:hypothetical protein